MKPAEVQIIKDTRGTLGVLDPLPEWVRRVYWMSAPAGQTRGGHRHHVTFQQVFCISGSVDVIWQLPANSGRTRLDVENSSLSLPPELFHEIHFIQSSVLLVLASELYDKSDYILEKYGEA